MIALDDNVCAASFPSEFQPGGKIMSRRLSLFRMLLLCIMCSRACMGMGLHWSRGGRADSRQRPCVRTVATQVEALLATQDHDYPGRCSWLYVTNLGLDPTATMRNGLNNSSANQPVRACTPWRSLWDVPSRKTTPIEFCGIGWNRVIPMQEAIRALGTQGPVTQQATGYTTSQSDVKP